MREHPVEPTPHTLVPLETNTQQFDNAVLREERHDPVEITRFKCLIEFRRGLTNRSFRIHEFSVSPTPITKPRTETDRSQSHPYRHVWAARTVDVGRVGGATGREHRWGSASCRCRSRFPRSASCTPVLERRSLRHRRATRRRQHTAGWRSVVRSR